MAGIVRVVVLFMAAQFVGVFWRSMTAEGYVMVFSEETILDFTVGAIDVAKLLTQDWLSLPLGGSCGLAAKYITPHIFNTSTTRGTLHTTFEYLTQECTAEYKHDINTCALLNMDFAVCLGFPLDARTSNRPWGFCSNQNSRVSYLWVPSNYTATLPTPMARWNMQKPSARSRSNVQKAALLGPSLPVPSIATPSVTLVPSVTIPAVTVPSVPIPSVPIPSLPPPSKPPPSIPPPSVLPPSIPPPSIPPPSIPPPSIPPPSIPPPSVPNPTVPAPSILTPIVPILPMPVPLVPIPSLPTPSISPPSMSPLSIPPPPMPNPIVPVPLVPIPSLPPPLVPILPLPVPLVPIPSLPTPSIPPLSISPPSMPNPSIPTPIVPIPLVPIPLVPIPSLPSPSMRTPLEPISIVPTPSVPPVCLSHGLANKTATDPIALAKIYKDTPTLNSIVQATKSKIGLEFAIPNHQTCDWGHSNLIPVAWDGIQNVLMAGQSLLSPDGTYSLTMQYDCNLVVYKRRPDGTTEWNAKWASFSQFNDPFQHECYLEFQPNGNLVVRDPFGEQRWSSGSTAPSLFSTALSVISCGNVIVLDMTLGTIIWATHTGHA